MIANPQRDLYGNRRVVTPRQFLYRGICQPRIKIQLTLKIHSHWLPENRARKRDILWWLGVDGRKTNPSLACHLFSQKSKHVWVQLLEYPLTTVYLEQSQVHWYGFIIPMYLSCDCKYSTPSVQIGHILLPFKEQQRPGLDTTTMTGRMCTTSPVHVAGNRA